MQNPTIKNIIEKIYQKYPKIDTILLFGSALNSGWTKESDIDLYFIDNNINDGRIDLEIDNVKIEIQADNFKDLLNNWSKVGAVGGDDWQWEVFYTEGKGIDPESENAKEWREYIFSKI